MVLINRFAVDHRLRRMPLIVFFRILITAAEIHYVPILTHVKVQPVGVMEPLRGARATWRMKRTQMRAAIPFPQSSRHRLNHLPLLVVLDRPIAAKDPNDAAV